MRNLNLGIPPTEDGLLANLMIFEYLLINVRPVKKNVGFPGGAPAPPDRPDSVFPGVLPLPPDSPGLFFGLVDYFTFFVFVVFDLFLGPVMKFHVECIKSYIWGPRGARDMATL